MSNKDTVDFGGAPAAPYFGPGGRQEVQQAADDAVEKDGRARNKQHDGPTAGPAEAAKEPALQGDREPEENRTKRDPASKKATDFDTKSKNAAETGQGEPTGDPEVEQPGTAPRAKNDFKHTSSTTAPAGEVAAQRAGEGVPSVDAEPQAEDVDPDGKKNPGGKKKVKS